MALKDQIVRAAVNGVEFPCLEFSDSRGNSSVPHRAYRVDGADIERTGREPLKIRIKAAFLNALLGRAWPADMFPGQHDLVESVFLETPHCTLTHPFYGNIDVHFDDFKRAFDPGTQQGVYVELEFTENNATAYYAVAIAQSPEPGAALAETAEAADEAVAALDDELPALAPVVDAKLAYLDDADRASAQAYAALAEIRTTAASLATAPSLAGIDGHDARGMLRAVEALTWDYAERYLTPRPQSREYVVPATMSLALVAAKAYGAADRAHLLRRANAIPDETRIPAGTTLKVPDDE